MTSQPLDGSPLLPGGMGLPIPPGAPNGEMPEGINPMVAELLKQQMLEKKKQEWASWVEQEFTRCKNARAPFERQWYLNLAFTSGRQYVSPIEVPGQGFRLTAPKAPPWRVRLVINKIRTAVRNECSKLTTSKPMPIVMPATNEDEDFSASRVGEALLKAAFANADFEKTYRSWIWWGVVTGVSYLKSYWDASAEDFDSRSLPEVPDMPDGSGPLPDEIIDQVPGMREMLDTPIPAVGKINMERVNPFHIYVPDLLAEKMEAQPYVIQVMTRSPLWVENKFGIKATPDSRASTTVMDAATLITRGSEEHLDAVLVKEIWIKPHAHKDFPKGGVLTIINSRVVQHIGEWPLPFPEYPFYKYDGIPTGGFYGDSVVVDLIPIQKEYNRTKSQMIEIKNTMGKPRILYQQGSINPRKLSSEPGQSVPYVAGYQPPVVMPGVEVPQSMSNELAELRTDFDDISSQHEISRGGTPRDVTSGTAIAFLQEQDDSKLSYQVASIEYACELLGKHYLFYVSTYWDDDRIVKVTGKNDSFEAIHWKKGALKGNTDVRVQTGSALPYSKAAKQALVTEWMQNGFLDPAVGMEVLNVGGLDKALDEALVDKRQAMRENLKMADAPVKMLKLLMEPVPGPNNEPPMQVPNPGGEGLPPVQLNGDGTPFQPQPPIPVNSWDNHEEHIHWHNQYRKTQEFELLDETIKQAFEMHVQLHQLALTANMVNTQGQVVQQNQPTEQELQAEAEAKVEAGGVANGGEAGGGPPPES